MTTDSILPLISAQASAVRDGLPAPSPARVLFMIDEMEAITAGGTERQLLQLAGIARRNGLEPAICVLRGTKWLTAEVAKCPVAHFEIDSIRTPGGIVALFRLARWMRSQKFTILLTFFSESNLLGPWIGKLAGVPVILGTRRNLSHVLHEAPARAVLRIQWLSNLLVDEILVNSNAVLQNTARCEWFSRRKLRVVYNGIELSSVAAQPGARDAMRQQLGVTGEQILVGNISGLRAIKGVLLFVEAAAMAVAVDARLRFVLVGEGEMRPALEAAIADYNLGGIFHLAGAAEDVCPYLAAMDIAVLCSTAEGMSNSLLEYMAAGLPAIATDVGGNREAIAEAGLLIPPSEPTALRDAIVRLLDPALRARYAELARAEVKRFDIANAAKEMGKIFRRHVPAHLTGLRQRDSDRSEKLNTVFDQVIPIPSETTGSVSDLIAACVRRNPSSASVAFQGRVMSHQELYRRAKGLGAALNQRGFGPGHTVAIYLERDLQLLEAIVGVLESGAAYVPLDPNDPDARVQSILQESGAVAVLTLQRHADALPPGVTPIFLDAQDLEIDQRPRQESVTTADSVAYVIYTSGSTGLPKGVAVTHGALTNLLLAMGGLLHVGPQDTMLAVTTFSFDIAGLEFLLPLVTGCSLEIASRDDAREPHRLLSLIRRQQISLLQATPITWQGLLDAGFESHPGMKMLCGGEAWSQPLGDRLLAGGGRLWNMYGPTETTIWSTAAEIFRGSPIVLGVPLLNTWVYLLDANAELIPGAGIGEIYIGGDGVAQGYHNQPELTSEKFLPDPFHAGGRMFRTGDLARRTYNGALQYVGRADNQIKLRGFRIELEEVEHALRATGLAEKCAVALKTDLRAQPRLVAYLQQPTIQTDLLRRTLFAALPGYMVPSVFVAVSALPLTHNSKVDRKRLPEPNWAALTPLREHTSQTNAEYAGPERRKGKVPGRADLQEHSPRNRVIDPAEMVAIWSSIFEEIQVTVDSDFFDLGGESIDFAELQTIVSAEFGIELTAEDILAAPTPAALSERVRTTGPQSDSARQIVPIRAEGDQPPLYLISQSLVFREVADQLGARQPVYAVKMGQEDADKLGPTPSFEKLAGFYADVIRRSQPEGPYRLGGWCVAGWLAFEVAKQLQTREGEVELLVVVDAWAPAYWRDMSWWKRIFAKFTYTLSRIRLHLTNMPARHKLRFLFKRLTSWMDESPGQILTQDATPLDRLVERAAQRYLPGRYTGNTLVFRSVEQPTGPFLPHDMGWAGLLEEAPRVVSLPGDHREILSGTAASMLASRIGDSLHAT